MRHRLVPVGALASAVLVVGVLGAAGCAGLGDRFKEPDVQLDRVVVRGLGLTGGTLDLVVNVHNPNNFNLQGTRLRVGFDVEGSHVGDVTYDDDFAVSKGDTTTLTLPLTFQWAGVGSAMRSALSYGDLPYKMKGEARLDTPFGERSFSFTREGRAPLTRAGGGFVVPTGRSR